jgi:enediyne biosynthesis protein E4
VVGNHGLNSRFKTSETTPLSLYVNDFDDNGMAEPIICGYNGGQSYPMVLRQDIVSQMPSLKKKYLYFINYKEQKISDIFTPEKVQKALKYEAFNLKSSILMNKGNGQFEIKDLPVEAQLSPIYGIAVEDFDKDGKLDIALSGNFSRSKPEVGTYLANYGTLLRGNGKGDFQIVKNAGFKIVGEVRDLLTLKTGNKNILITSLNNDFPKVFGY